MAQGAKTDSLEARIRELEARIDSLIAALARGGPAHDAQSELEALRAAARAAAGEERPDTVQASRTRNLNMLNPEISATGDILGGYSAPAGEDGGAVFVPREFEFSFQAALDPSTRTKIFITFEEPLEIAGLPKEETEEEGGTEIAIEEGYMYWVSLPAQFGARIGKFRQEISLYNRWHSHALLEIDRPLASMTFLGEDGLIQTGAGLTLPSLTLGPSTATATVEATLGNSEALFDGGNDLSYLARIQSFWDLGASSFIQVGATGVYGSNDDESLDTHLLELDLYYSWIPPGQSLYRGFSLKGEWFFAGKDFGGTEVSGKGGYLQANFRVNRRWTIGSRVDYLDDYGAGPNITQFVPSLTYWQSEWVRFRLQYNYVKPEGAGASSTLLLQTVWAAGPHKHETY